MRNTNRTIAFGAAALVAVLLASASTFAAPGGARPSDPPPPVQPAPPAPPAPAGGAPGGAKPDPGPTVNDPRGDPDLSKSHLEIAADRLREEYAASLKNPRAGLREQSSYFIERPAQVHQGALINALEKASLPDQRGLVDARRTAYVRWQLLSAAPKEGAWQKDLIPRLSELYRKAPVPTARYGLSPVDQRKLDTLLASTPKDEAMRLNDMIDDRVVKEAEANRLVFAYRDSFYSTFPIGYDRFANGLRDAFERLGYGWDPKDLMKRIETEATTWANSGAGDPKQYAAIAQLVFRLRSERSPRYYVGVGTSRTTKQPYWMTRTDALYEAKKLADLQKLLEEKGNVRRPTVE